MSKYNSPFSRGYRKPIVLSKNDIRNNNLGIHKNRVGSDILINNFDINPKKIGPENPLIWIRQQGQSQASTINDIFSYNSDIYTIGSLGEDKMILEKTKDNGNKVFSKVFNPPTSSKIYGNSICKNGDYLYAAGYIYESNTSPTEKVTVYKTDISGNEIWKLKISGLYTYAVTPKICPSENGGTYLLWGRNLIKLDADGNIVWKKAFYAASYYDLPATLKDLKFYDNELYVCGISNSNPILLKLDTYGNIIFLKQISYNGISGQDGMFSMNTLAIDNNKNIYFGSSPEYSVKFGKINPSFEVEWAKIIHDDPYLPTEIIKINIDNKNKIVVNASRSILKYNSDSSIISNKNFGIGEALDSIVGSKPITIFNLDNIESIYLSLNYQKISGISKGVLAKIPNSSYVAVGYDNIFQSYFKLQNGSYLTETDVKSKISISDYSFSNTTSFADAIKF